MVRYRIGRNDPCPCGSGVKFKKCCLDEDAATRAEVARQNPEKSLIRLKSPADVDAIREAGRLVVDTLWHVESALRPGIETEHINNLVHKFTIERGAIPAPLHYKGYPKSVCVSVNDVVCHGIPGERILAEGDIVNVDVTSILKGYYADANMTFFVGEPSQQAEKIVRVARECLRIGMSVVRPGKTIGDIGWVIQTYAEWRRSSS